MAPSAASDSAAVAGMSPVCSEPPAVTLTVTVTTPSAVPPGSTAIGVESVEVQFRTVFDEAAAHPQGELDGVQPRMVWPGGRSTDSSGSWYACPPDAIDGTRLSRYVLSPVALEGFTEAVIESTGVDVTVTEEVRAWTGAASAGSDSVWEVCIGCSIPLAPAEISTVATTSPRTVLAAMGVDWVDVQANTVDPAEVAHPQDPGGEATQPAKVSPLGSVAPSWGSL
jgi:hypothetical protein